MLKIKEVTRFECNFSNHCNREFKTQEECIMHYVNAHMCPTCKNAVYVYGNELVCKVFKNNKIKLNPETGCGKYEK